MMRWILAGLGTAILAGIWLVPGADKPPAAIRPVLMDEPMALQPFQLTDHRRRPLGVERLQGHWTLVTFGYTHCPDICPANLLQLAALKRMLQEKHPQRPVPRLLFISVDPQRDTPERLAEYVAYFDPELTGASAAPEALGVLEQQLGAFHRLGKPRANGWYSVDHSAETFLIDPRGRLYARFPPPMQLENVAEQYAALTAYYASP